MTTPSSSPGAHALEAQRRHVERLRGQRSTLRPVALAVGAAVVIAAASATPRPSITGTGLAVTAALVLFLATLLRATSPTAVERQSDVRAAGLTIMMGAAAVGLVAVHPHGATELAAGATVFIAAARLPAVAGGAIAAATGIGLVAALAATGSGTSAVLAAVLFCGLLAVVAYFVKQAREGQARSEVLLAELEDAREEQVRAAATEERGRIAGELHDVLAHSLSGAAIQLQGARLLADRENAPTEIREAIDRAAGLVKDGLADARSAVSALRGDDLPSVTRIPELIESFRADVNADVSFALAGTPRPLPPNASLALYRATQEALTNIARYAPGAKTTVTLHYGPVTRLRVDNSGTRTDSSTALRAAGGGHGLDGMRERVERAGGRMSAGPTDDGWRVELEVPA